MVILYSQPTCAPCKVVERELTKAGIDYEKVNVQEDALSAELLKASGFKGTPVIQFSGGLVGMSGLRDVIRAGA
jgi:glutaredoxin